MVHIEAEGSSVLLRLTSEEAERLAVAILVAFETISRSEYYIRSGLSHTDVRVLADAIDAAATSGTSASVPPLPGVEEEENPRRQR